MINRGQAPHYSVCSWLEKINNKILNFNRRNITLRLSTTTIAKGWRVQTMEKDIRRMLLFWSKEAYVVGLGREK
jgi:hypothetical protein